MTLIPRTFLSLLLVAIFNGPSFAATRVEIPIVQHRLSNGEIRFTTAIRVGNGVPIDAMVDTGSFGLRVLARALTSPQYKDTGILRHYGFASGVVLNGPLATATVTIGPLSLPGLTNIQIVQSVSCRETSPHCPASQVTPDAYGIGGDGLPREGYNAILGLSLRSPAVPGAAINPLLGFESKRWIVVLPRPNSSENGRLIINPGATDVAGFHPVYLRTSEKGQIGTSPQVKDSEIPNCLDQPLEQQALCPTMHLDSGARQGIAPFYSYAVLYDGEHHSISVKRRDN